MLCAPIMNFSTSFFGTLVANQSILNGAFSTFGRYSACQTNLSIWLAMAKVEKVMKEYKEGTLHSGKGGPVVKSREQAIAIALSEAEKAKKKK